MELEVIFAFMKPDSNTGKMRTFKRGERYEAVGDSYKQLVPCSCPSKQGDWHTFQNIMVDGMVYQVDAEFLGPTSAFVEPQVIESLTDDLNTIGKHPDPWDDRPLPVDQSDANWKKFNDLAIFDLRKK